MQTQMTTNCPFCSKEITMYFNDEGRAPVIEQHFCAPKKIKVVKAEKVTVLSTDKFTIALSNIASVYSGKEGMCCCGCAGNHRYASVHQVWAGKNRGYAVGDDEVNDVQVKRIFNLFITNVLSVVDLGDGVFTLNKDGRDYVIYMVGR